MSANPLLIAGLAAGGLFLYSRRAAAQQALVGNANNQVRYTTPTGIAESLARIVVSLTKGVTPPEPLGIFSDKIVAPAAPGGSSELGTAGWNLIDWMGASNGSGDPYNPDPGWSLPTASKVADASVARFGQSIDQIAAAPVYDPSTDFISNPFGGFTFGGGF